MIQMNIHEALAKIKLIQKKLESHEQNKYITMRQIDSDVNYKNKNIKEWTKNANSNFQAYIDLFNYKCKLKTAIMKANTINTITINNNTITISEALVLKQEIENLIDFITAIENEISYYEDEVEKENQKIKKQSLDFIKSKEISDLTNNLIQEYIKQNSLEIYIPKDIEVNIKKYKENIDSFLNNIDFRISTSNSLNVIEVDDNINNILLG